ncbi:hypothetical protein V1525DRAFT_124230 [Lipomyces kononenkoae]|uniref:Uncharacterized protein n=1 Tax=Lipomyces kononenkoae TaxID=34357 RepID=A0ACC3T2K7_LIPKO
MTPSAYPAMFDRSEDAITIFSIAIVLAFAYPENFLEPDSACSEMKSEAGISEEMRLSVSTCVSRVVAWVPGLIPVPSFCFGNLLAVNTGESVEHQSYHANALVLSGSSAIFLLFLSCSRCIPIFRMRSSDHKCWRKCSKRLSRTYCCDGAAGKGYLAACHAVGDKEWTID